MFPPATLPPSIDFGVPAIEQSNAAAAATPRAPRARQTIASGDFTHVARASSSLSLATINGEEPAWSFAISEAAARLRALPAGWDGPGSKPVANHALFRAETLVRSALEGRSSATAPYLVPGGDGSIQIEWHEREGEIELSISPNGDIYLCGRSHLSGQEIEGEGEEAVALFARWAPRLASDAHDEVDVSPQGEEIDLITA